jgi:hypothetical protein
MDLIKQQLTGEILSNICTQVGNFNHALLILKFLGRFIIFDEIFAVFLNTEKKTNKKALKIKIKIKSSPER